MHAVIFHPVTADVTHYAETREAPAFSVLTLFDKRGSHVVIHTTRNVAEAMAQGFRSGAAAPDVVNVELRGGIW